MRAFLLPVLSLAIVMMPGAADAASQCRNAKGQFAKCGAPGAMTDAQYKASKGKPAVAAPAKPAMAAAKPAAPAAKPATKPAPCKDAKGKFIKCK